MFVYLLVTCLYVNDNFFMPPQCKVVSVHDSFEGAWRASAEFCQGNGRCADSMSVESFKVEANK